MNPAEPRDEEPELNISTSASGVAWKGTPASVPDDGYITIGRAGDVVIGVSDEFLNRVVILVWWSGTNWWLKNNSSQLLIHLYAPGARAVLMPGAGARVPSAPSRAFFSTTRGEYRVDFHAPALEPQPTFIKVPDATATSGNFVPNEEQEKLLRELVRPLNERQPDAKDADVPTIQELAEVLNWTPNRVNKKLIYLRDRLELHGILLGNGQQGGSVNDGKPLRVTMAWWAFGAQEWWSGAVHEHRYYRDKQH